MFDRNFESFAGGSAGIPVFDCFSLKDFIVSQSLLQAAVIVTAAAFLGGLGCSDAAGRVRSLIVLLLALGVTAQPGLGLLVPRLVTLNCCNFCYQPASCFCQHCLAPHLLCLNGCRTSLRLNPAMRLN